MTTVTPQTIVAASVATAEVFGQSRAVTVMRARGIASPEQQRSPTIVLRAVSIESPEGWLAGEIDHDNDNDTRPGAA